MLHELRDYQNLAVNDAVAFARDGGRRRLYAAPTGSGKSVIELATQDRLPGWWLVTPRLEIAAGMLQKRGVQAAGLSDAKLADLAWQWRITTPTRFRNRLLAGSVGDVPGLLLDEAHHDSASTWTDLHTLCDCPAIGYTATPFRGSPESTRKFLETWGEPVWILSFADAVARGVVTMPTCRTVPLVDDDQIEIVNGELVATQITHSTATRLGQVCELVSDWPGDKPSLIAVSSTEIARLLAERLPAAVAVTQESSRAERDQAFADCLACRKILVQINVVSEGVDLAVRRLLDLSPTMSPVRWLQQFGRITRPGGGSEYVCCNRNLLRHAYLLDGCLPASDYAKSAALFPPSSRFAYRALGLEGLGRFKAAPVHYADGLRGEMYAVSGSEGNQTRHYCVIVHPLSDEPLWATRTNERAGDGTMKYGRWRQCDPPKDFRGFASVSPAAVTEKQKSWFLRSAKRFGLDPTAKIDRKTFSVLPVLADLGRKVG